MWGKKGSVSVFESEREELVGEILEGGCKAPVTSLCESEGEGGKCLLVGLGDGRIVKRSCRTGNKVFEVMGHTDWVRELVEVRGRVWSCSDDCSLKVWDSSTGKLLHSSTLHRGSVNCLGVVSVVEEVGEGRGEERREEVWSGSSDKLIHRWHSLSFRHLGHFSPHHSRITSVKSLGGLVFTGSGDGSLKVWSSSLRCVRSIEGFKKAIISSITPILHPSLPPQMWVGRGDGSILLFSLF